MSLLQGALYARVSSDQQSQAQTIQSQLAALRARIEADGVQLAPHGEFVDDGYSGSTLIRPALERLRDAVANGGIDRLYVHSPDRLARKYAYQVLLVDEWQRAGLEIVFLNRASCKTLRPPPAINENASHLRIVEPEHARAGSGMCVLQATGTSITRFCAKQPVAPHRRPTLPRLWDAGRTRSRTAGIGRR